MVTDLFLLLYGVPLCIVALGNWMEIYRCAHIVTGNNGKPKGGVEFLAQVYRLQLSALRKSVYQLVDYMVHVYSIKHKTSLVLFASRLLGYI